MRETVDPVVNEFYRQALAAGANYRGYTTLNHADQIGQMIEKHRAWRLLDYGCGAGHQYTEKGLHMLWGVAIPTLYDPASEEHWIKPLGTFDGVICVDVLEHIPKRFVANVLDELFAYAERFIFAAVCCRPAKKLFPDGRNTHLTVHGFDWWTEQFKARATDNIDYQLVCAP